MNGNDEFGVLPERRRRRIAGALAAMLALASLAVPAFGDPFGVGGRDSGWLADNHDHDYCWSENFTWANLQEIAHEAMDYLESVTDFSGGSHHGNCNSGTDVYFQRYHTTAYRGRYQCDDRSGNVCDNADVRISSHTGTLPSAERRKTVCHEIGHSAGATHHSSGWGCMVRGSSTSETYTAHTRNHMNQLEVAES